MDQVWRRRDVVCSLDGYPEKKGTGVEEDDYVLCGLDGYMEMKGTGLEGGET